MDLDKYKEVSKIMAKTIIGGIYEIKDLFFKDGHVNFAELSGRLYDNVMSELNKIF